MGRTNLDRLTEYKFKVLKLLDNSPNGIDVNRKSLRWVQGILYRNVPLEDYMLPIIGQLIYKDHCATLKNGRAYINEHGKQKLQEYGNNITECQLPFI